MRSRNVLLYLGNLWSSSSIHSKINKYLECEGRTPCRTKFSKTKHSDYAKLRLIISISGFASNFLKTFLISPSGKDDSNMEAICSLRNLSFQKLGMQCNSKLNLMTLCVILASCLRFPDCPTCSVGSQIFHTPGRYVIVGMLLLQLPGVSGIPLI